VDVDADALTAILADRLGKIVPAGFHVEARDGMLWYSADSGRFPGQGGEYCVGTSGTFVRDNLEARGETAEDRIAALHLWYGAADVGGEVVLACEPISLAQLRSA
jgi:hypothetical protein